MKAIIFSLLMLLSACMPIDYPDRFVTTVMFTSHIVNVGWFRITTKDELLEFVNTTVTSGYTYDAFSMSHKFSNSHFYKGDLVLRPVPYTDVVVYIKPFSQGVAILDSNLYEFGMPIRSRDNRQGIILIKGNPEWADSSYNGFVILPVCNSNDDCSDLDFTWDIKEI